MTQRMNRNYDVLPDPLFQTMIQHINVSVDMSRSGIHELGRHQPYYKYVNFPVDIDVEYTTEKQGVLIGEKMYKIYVTGGSSMIGRQVVSKLRKEGYTVCAPTHNECDLLKYSNVYDSIVSFGPNSIIHLAGWNGGVSWNAKYPATIYSRTVTMALNLYNAAVESKTKIDKIVGVLASCSYPDLKSGVFNAEDLYKGLPNSTVECHGLAKRTIFDYGRQVYKQYGIPCVAAVLTNAYGPWDSFHPEKTKVVGALIRKFVEAKANNLPQVVCWGTGAPKRQLIYAEDAADAIIDILHNYNDPFLPINIGSDSEISIKDLTVLIANTVGYTGEIVWDTSKPDGQMRKFINTPFKAKTPIKDGIAKTVEWYTANKKEADEKGF